MNKILQLFFSKPLEYSSGDFIARFNTRKFKIALLTISIPLLLAIIIRWETIMKWPILETISFLTFIIGVVMFFLLRILDKTPRIVISNSGISTKKLALKWDEIEYFYIEGLKAKEESMLYFNFKLKNSDKKYKIETSELDKSYVEIYSAVINYSKEHNIIELVHTIG